MKTDLPSTITLTDCLAEINFALSFLEATTMQRKRLSAFRDALEQQLKLIPTTMLDELAHLSQHWRNAATDYRCQGLPHTADLLDICADSLEKTVKNNYKIS